MSDTTTDWAAKHDAWQQLRAVRSPGDVPVGTPISWQAEKYGDAGQRLLNNRLPADFPHEVERGTAADSLTRLALGTTLVRDLTSARGSTLHEALNLGATWSEIAAALDTTPEQARQELRAYADGQRHLYEQYGHKPFGFTAEEHAAVLALTELGDDQPPRLPAVRPEDS